MAKSTTEETGSAVRGNGYDPDAVKSFVARIETVQAEIDEINTQAQLDCGPKREDLAAIKKEATDAGIPRNALAAALRERRLRKKADGIRDDLSKDDQGSLRQHQGRAGRVRQHRSGISGRRCG